MKDTPGSNTWSCYSKGKHPGLELCVGSGHAAVLPHLLAGVAHQPRHLHNTHLVEAPIALLSIHDAVGEVALLFGEPEGSTATEGGKGGKVA